MRRVLPAGLFVAPLVFSSTGVFLESTLRPLLLSTAVQRGWAYRYGRMLRAFPACSGSRRLVGSLSAARPRAKLRKKKALLRCPRPSWDKSVGSPAKDLKALKGAPRLVCQRRGAGCACPTRSSSHGRRFGSHLGGGGDGREPPAVRARASRASKAAGVAAARACGADPREVE